MALGDSDKRRRSAYAWSARRSDRTVNETRFTGTTCLPVRVVGQSVHEPRFAGTTCLPACPFVWSEGPRGLYALACPCLTVRLHLNTLLHCQITSVIRHAKEYTESTFVRIRLQRLDAAKQTVCVCLSVLASSLLWLRWFLYRRRGRGPHYGRAVPSRGALRCYVTFMDLNATLLRKPPRQAQATQSPVGRSDGFLRTLDVYGRPVRTAIHVYGLDVRRRGSISLSTLDRTAFLYINT